MGCLWAGAGACAKVVVASGHHANDKTKAEASRLFMSVLFYNEAFARLDAFFRYRFLRGWEERLDSVGAGWCAAKAEMGFKR